jgi:SOS-response transcriptional repressor LexA
MVENTQLEQTQSTLNSRRGNVGDFQDRVRTILLQLKRTKAWLAVEMGISKQNLNYLLNHATKIKHIDSLSRTLNINPQWLMHGTGPVNLSSEHKQPHHRVIPLMPWPKKVSPVFAESLGQKPTVHQPCLIGELNLPANCFAMHLKCRSMEPHFRIGSLLIFDPNRAPQNKDYVVAGYSESGDLVFRQYIAHEDGRLSLHFLNRNEIKDTNSGSFKVYGVLVQKRLNYIN